MKKSFRTSGLGSAFFALIYLSKFIDFSVVFRTDLIAHLSDFFSFCYSSFKLLLKKEKKNVYMSQCFR